MVKHIAVALILAAVAFGEGSTKPSAPVPTDQAKAKMLGVVVHQQQVQLQLKQLEEAYKGLLGTAQQLAGDNDAAQKEVLKSANADDNKHAVSVSVDGQVTIIPKPEPKKEEEKKK